MSPIIPVSTPDCQSPSWKNLLKNAYDTPTRLLNAIKVDPAQLDFELDHSNPFSMRVPQPFVDKMQTGNPRDPLLLQVLASQQENLQVSGYQSDPLQESSFSDSGLIHKYHGRVLMILSSACAINCRYCFRRHFPYTEQHASGKQLEKALHYIQSDRSISEVILSGGDPLMLSDQSLSQLYQQLEAIAHVRRVRIHTRLPVVLPQRITSSLTDIFSRSRIKTLIVLHINHGQEIDPLFHAAMKKLTNISVPLLNQSVLLKSINDCPDKLAHLSEALFEAGILPYYIHTLDKVAGAAHFDLPQREALEIIAAMRARLPGYLVPRLAIEEPGKSAKTVLA